MSSGDTILSALGDFRDLLFPWSGSAQTKKYLRDATQESILRDLRATLKRRTLERRTLKDGQLAELEKTFYKYAFQDQSSKRRYWNEESFGEHMKQTHPDLAGSQAAIQLLWRSFYFHAFHPFPDSSTDEKIDWEAFQRAFLLQVAQGADLLGVLEEADMYWQFQYDQNLVHQAKVKRIFRSIAVPELTTALTEDESKFAAEETADVVAILQPFFPPHAPVQEEVFPAAKRLFAGNTTQSRRRVARKDFATLLSILIRLRLDASAPFGRFEKADPGDELPTILLDSLGGQDQDYLDLDQVTSILYLLPNLYIRFSQIWKVLFQSHMPADFGTQTEAHSGISGQAIGAISLFVPHPITGVNGPMEEEDRRIAIEPIQISLNGDISAVTVIAKALASDLRPRLILITGKNTKTSQSTVIGTSLPSALSGGVSLSLFFELKPKFRLHRWSSYNKGLTSMLFRDGSKNVKSLLSRESNANPPGDLESNEPFWIGGPEGEEACIKIDPARKLATSLCLSTEIQVKYSHFAALGISGGEPAVLPGLMNTSTTWAKGLPGTFQQGPETGVNQGNELRTWSIGLGSV